MAEAVKDIQGEREKLGTGKLFDSDSSAESVAMKTAYVDGKIKGIKQVFEKFSINLDEVTLE